MSCRTTARNSCASGLRNTGVICKFRPGARLAISRQSSRAPARRDRCGFAGTAMLFRLCPRGASLAPVDNGLNLHQAQERPRKAAGIREAEPCGDIANAVIGFDEQMAGHADPDFHDKLAVARAVVGESSLKRTCADSELLGRAREIRAPVPHRCGDGRPNCVFGWCLDSPHQVSQGALSLPLQATVPSTIRKLRLGMAFARQKDRRRRFAASRGSTLRKIIDK
jgi:hypothetical protein